MTQVKRAGQAGRPQTTGGGRNGHAMPHFFLKLVPPRPTFAQDMNDDEKAAMGRHLVYLQSLIDSGVGTAFGPVMDPSGVYGMGIVEAADDAGARAITEKDPVVLAGIGRYEIFPMRVIKKG